MEGARKLAQHWAGGARFIERDLHFQSAASVPAFNHRELDCAGARRAWSAGWACNPCPLACSAYNLLERLAHGPAGEFDTRIFASATFQSLANVSFADVEL